MITVKIRNEIYVGSDILEVAKEAYGPNVHIHYESDGEDIKRIAWVGNYRAGEIKVLSFKGRGIYVDFIDEDED